MDKRFKEANIFLIYWNINIQIKYASCIWLENPFELGVTVVNLEYSMNIDWSEVIPVTNLEAKTCFYCFLPTIKAKNTLF